MKIAVAGTGYVGLVTGTCFADMGHTVTCVDIDAGKIARLEKGEIPIYEPGLDHLVARNRKEGRLFFSTDLGASVKGVAAAFIAVGTPPGEDGSADLKYVLAAAETIAKNLSGYTVVINKSTVPVGTGEKVAAVLAAHAKQPFDVVSNPEFLKEGTAIDDFMRPDRVVIGVSNDRSRKVMEEMYAPFLRNGHPIHFMDVKSAEVTKYAANAMLAVRISFMNEIAKLCDSVGADARMVRQGIGTDKRIGMPFLYPGIGYGGSCFPKDVKALIQTAKENGQDFGILKAVEAVNEEQKTLLVTRMKKMFGSLRGRTVAIWGLAFKPETDDVREAPALAIIEDLLAEGATVRVTDPEAIESTRRVLGDRVGYFTDRYEAAKGASALVVCTEWNEYRNPDFAKLKETLAEAVLFDGRNLYLESIVGQGFRYECVGSNSRFAGGRA